MAALSQAQLQAASEFGTAAMKAFDQDGTFPAQIVIGSVARMAGSFLFRSFGLALSGIQPGSVVLSEQANEQGPRLIQILGGVLENLGVKLDPSRLSASQRMTRGQKEPFGCDARMSSTFSPSSLPPPAGMVTPRTTFSPLS